MSATQPFITFVVPVFNEERVLLAGLATLAEFLEELSKAAGRTPLDWELLCVDDGSTDSSA